MSFEKEAIRKGPLTEVSTLTVQKELSRLSISGESGDTVMAAAAAATRGGPGNVQGLVKQAEQRLSLDTTTSPSRKWTAFDDTHLPSKPSLEIEVPIAHKPPTGRFAKQLSLSDMELSDSEEVCLVSPFGLSPSGQPPRTLISQFSQSYGTSPTPSWSWGWGRLPVKADSKARSLHFVTLFFLVPGSPLFCCLPEGISLPAVRPKSAYLPGGNESGGPEGI